MVKYKNGKEARVGDTVKIGDSAGIVLHVDARCNGLCVAVSRIPLPGEQAQVEFWDSEGTNRLGVYVVSERVEANKVLPISSLTDRSDADTKIVARPKSAPRTKKRPKRTR